jgi:hypothetical protein
MNSENRIHGECDLPFSDAKRNETTCDTARHPEKDA